MTHSTSKLIPAEAQRDGRLTVQSRDTESAQMIDRLGRRVVAGLVASACIVAGSWLITKQPAVQWAGGALLAVAALWLSVHVALDLRRR